MSKAVYPKGVRVFAPRDNAPQFVKGSVLITLDEFKQFVNENQQYLSEYKGMKQLKLNLLEGDNGIYMTVDTWKPDPNYKKAQDDNVVNPAPEGEDDLPF